jgi:hypothetical protein
MMKRMMIAKVSGAAPDALASRFTTARVGAMKALARLPVAARFCVPR